MRKKQPGCLGYIGYKKLPIYMGIVMNHYKNPYSPASIMESKRVFFVAQWIFFWTKETERFTSGVAPPQWQIKVYQEMITESSYLFS